MKITTIIFDYNGLLVDDLGIHLNCFVEIARKYNPELDEQKIKDILSGTSTLKKIELIMGNASKKTVERVEEIEKPKPDPSSVIKTMKILGKEPGECCYAGDAPNDMKAAKSAGILAIGIPTGLDSREDLERAG